MALLYAYRYVCSNKDEYGRLSVVCQDWRPHQNCTNTQVFLGY